MKHTLHYLTRLTLISGIFITSQVYATELRVSASIRPLYFITAAIMQGTGQPELLLDAMQSPHHYHLQPSQLRRLNRSDVILWIGPSLESTLAKPISNLSEPINKKALITTANLFLRQIENPSHHPGIHAHTDNFPDPHIWLDTGNAVLLAEQITTILAAKAPANSRIYLDNLAQFRIDLSNTKTEIQQILKPVAESRILAMHNAWGYFSMSFNLENYSAIEADGLDQLGAKSFYRLKKQISSGNFDCIIYGPETNQKKLHELTANSPSKQVRLDPLAFDLAMSTDFSTYLKLIARGLSGCNTTTKRAG